MRLSTMPSALHARLAGLLLAGLCLAAAPAAAHDTWFRTRPDASPPALWLGTGNRFPVLESRVEFAHLQRHGCAPQSELAARGVGAGRALSAVSGPAGREPSALVLRLPAAAADRQAAAHTCWASLVPFDIEIEPAKVEVYLKEIAAGPALHAAWAAERAAGRPWRERYVKHARVDIGGASTVPVGLPLEAVLTRAGRPRKGDELRVQLLLDGKPLADHPFELVSEHGHFGLWRRTDALGQASAALPLAGQWLLRSTVLRPPLQPGERWHSDFVTLAFDVEGPAP